jgi:hypothetical protein
LTNIKELEKLFFKVIGDLEEYLPYLVLVGGWVPYLYVKYLWKNLSIYPVTTTDIDFGVFEGEQTPSVSEPIYSRFSKLQYKERHLKMRRLFPVVPLLEDAEKKSRLMIEFITAPDRKKRGQARRGKKRGKKRKKMAEFDRVVITTYYVLHTTYYFISSTCSSHSSSSSFSYK